MRNLFQLNIHPKPTHPKTLLFACQNGIGNFNKPFMAEIRITEKGIEACNGQDYPIGVLGLVGAVIGYECMNDFVWNILGCKRGDRLNILGREGYFIFSKCPKL